MEKAKENIYFCFTDYTKAFNCVDHNKLWKILKEMGIPDYLTCLLRNLYVGQEATVRTGHGTADLFKIGKEVCQGSILSPCLFNLHAKSVCVCGCVCVCGYVCVWAESFSHAPLFVTPWTVAHQVLLSMEFSRQEYRSGLPFSSPRDLPDPGIKPRSPALQTDSLSNELQGKPYVPCLQLFQENMAGSQSWT